MDSAEADIPLSDPEACLDETMVAHDKSGSESDDDSGSSDGSSDEASGEEQLDSSSSDESEERQAPAPAPSPEPMPAPCAPPAPRAPAASSSAQGGTGLQGQPSDVVELPLGLIRTLASAWTFLWTDSRGTQHHLVLRRPSRTQKHGAWMALCGHHPLVGRTKCTRTASCANKSQLLNLVQEFQTDAIDTALVGRLQGWLEACEAVGARDDHKHLPH